MKSTNRFARSLITFAAVSALSGGSIALAQFQVHNGNVLDANSRVGSGGVNEVDTRLNPWEVSNAIVNGNVTGGKQFRGRVESGDSFAFRGGPTGDSVSDHFIRSSSGVNTNGMVSNNAGSTNLYFGSSRAAPISPNITQTGLALQQQPNGAFTPVQPQSWSQVDPRQSTAGSVTTVFAPSTIGGAGPVDTGYAPNAVSLAPSTSVRDLSSGVLSDYTQIQPDTTVSNLSPDQLSAIRNSLSNPAMQNQANQTDNGQPTPTNQINDSLQSPAIQTAKPLNDSSSMDDSIPAAQMMSNLPGQQQSSEPGMVTKVIGKGADNSQSSMYDSLAQRRAEQEQALRPGEAAEQAAKTFNNQMRTRKADEAKKNGNDQPAPNGAKPGDKAGDKPGAAGAKSTVPQPLHVNSLTAPGDSSGVGNMLKKAEQQMREGKFASAVDTYDAAEALAPKNSLIKLGRANAELGGSYYRRAETDLRQTLATDKNLLAGQYDLRSFLGEDRLQIIQKDLSEQVQNKPTDVGSAVLLAYVYYNTGNERRAAGMLDLADKRAGGKDDFVKLLKANWNFGADNK